jgi:hypothetical protein
VPEREAAVISYSILVWVSGMLGFGGWGSIALLASLQGTGIGRRAPWR